MKKQTMKISMKQKFNRSSSSYTRLIKNCRCSGIIILFPYGEEGDKDIGIECTWRLDIFCWYDKKSGHSRVIQ